MLSLSEHDKKLLEQSDPSQFLCYKLTPVVELSPFIEVTNEIYEDLPHFGFRIVLNEKKSLDSNIAAALTSFPEFFINRILPYFHYYMDRGTLYQPINEVILIIVYFDFIVKYKVKLPDMDIQSPIDLRQYSNEAVKSIKLIEKFLTLQDEMTEVCFNEPTFNRDHILKEIQHG